MAAKTLNDQLLETHKIVCNMAADISKNIQFIKETMNQMEIEKTVSDMKKHTKIAMQTVEKIQKNFEEMQLIEEKENELIREIEENDLKRKIKELKKE